MLNRCKLFVLLFVILCSAVTYASVILPENSMVSYVSTKQVNNVGMGGLEKVYFDIPKFNSGIGSLDRVGINLSFSFSGRVQVYALDINEPINIQSGDARCFVSPQSVVSWKLFEYMWEDVPVSGVLTDENTPITCADFVWNGQYDIELQKSLNKGLDDYIGDGNIDLQLWAGFAHDVQGEYLAVYQDGGKLDVQCNLTYYYTVPEPAALSLLALGGMFLKRRR